MSSREGTMPLGWIVRVTMKDGMQVLYRVGLPTLTEAEKAVEESRDIPGETYQAVDPITSSHGGGVESGEVTELTS